MDEKTLIGLGSIALGAISKLAIEWYNNRKVSQSNADCFITLGKVQNQLKTFCDETKFDRVVIFQVPRGGKRRLSIILEHTNISSIYNHYQDYPFDNDYRLLLENLQKVRTINKYITGDETYALKHSYTLDNIKSVKKFHIYKGKKYNYYMNCHSTSIVDFDDPNTNIYYKAMLGFIANNFKVYAP